MIERVDMSGEGITVLDDGRLMYEDTHHKSTCSERFPNIRILNDNPEQLVTLISVLGEGDLTVNIKDEENWMTICTLPYSITALTKVLRFWPVELRISPTQTIRLESPVDVYAKLEGIEWTG